MSDSIGGAFKDLAHETVKQVAETPVGFVKGAGAQILGSETDEEKKKRKAQRILEHQRIQQIEAEMAQIRTHDTRKAEETKSEYRKTLQTLAGKKQKKLDESSRQAIGKAEQGRNFKG